MRPENALYYLLFVLFLLFTVVGCSSNPKVPKPEPSVITQTKIIYRVPNIPEEWLTPEPVPNGAPWKNKTQKDVAEYIIQLHRSLNRSNEKIISIGTTLKKLKKLDTISNDQNLSNKEQNDKQQEKK